MPCTARNADSRKNPVPNSHLTEPEKNSDVFPSFTSLVRLPTMPNTKAAMSIGISTTLSRLNRPPDSTATAGWNTDAQLEAPDAAISVSTSGSTVFICADIDPSVSAHSANILAVAPPTTAITAAIAAKCTTLLTLSEDLPPLIAPSTEYTIAIATTVTSRDSSAETLVPNRLRMKESRSEKSRENSPLTTLFTTETKSVPPKISDCSCPRPESSPFSSPESRAPSISSA